MALLLTSPPSLLSKNPKTTTSTAVKTHSFSASLLPKPAAVEHNRFSTALRLYSANSSDPLRGNRWSTSDDEEIDERSDEDDGAPKSGIVDEWGERAEPDPEPPTKLPEADPAGDDDEWGGVGVSDDDYVLSGNGSAGVNAGVDDKLMELKRCLVDSVYGTDLGFRASPEVRAEVSELVNQLEAANPTPAPTEATEVLDGNWVLVYTAFSELLPLLAAGTTPLLKVERICQAINTGNLTIENSTKLSNPFATFSFSASASFEVRTPSRIQVRFKEGTFQPPEIKSNINLPDNVDIFGQKINLSPVQQSLNPLQEAVASIARAISGQSPLKIPIPGERTQSWLLITYLDKDLRISRGDGGLFVLVKDGSSLLDY